MDWPRQARKYRNGVWGGLGGRSPPKVRSGWVRVPSRPSIVTVDIMYGLAPARLRNKAWTGPCQARK